MQNWKQTLILEKKNLLKSSQHDPLWVSVTPLFACYRSFALLCCFFFGCWSCLLDIFAFCCDNSLCKNKKTSSEKTAKPTKHRRILLSEKYSLIYYEIIMYIWSRNEKPAAVFGNLHANFIWRFFLWFEHWKTENVLIKSFDQLLYLFATEHFSSVGILQFQLFEAAWSIFLRILLNQSCRLESRWDMLIDL